MADTTFTRDSVTRKLRDMGDGSFAEVVTNLPAVSDTVSGAGSVTAPGALGTVATTGLLADGIYDVSFGYFLSGTAETAMANVRIRKNTPSTIADNMPSISAAPPVTDDIKRITLSGGRAIQIVAIVAAAAGSQYNGWLIATRVA